MTDIKFKKVDDTRRQAIRQPSDYDELFGALMAGDTLELDVTKESAQRIRAAWTKREFGRSLHLRTDGKTYVAWSDPPSP